MGIKMQVKATNKRIHAKTDGNILLAQYNEILDTVNAIPVGVGAYANSIQFKNGNNQTYSDYTVALGLSNIAGSKAYPIIGLDKNGSYYVVKLNQDENIDTNIIGHKYSIFLSGSIDNCGTIVDIRDNRIYVDYLYIPDKDITYEDAFIKIIGMPQVGNISIGTGAASFGCECVSSAIGALSHGLNAVANGRYAYSGGKDTYANFAAHAEGQGTQALDWGTHAEGLWTIAVKKAGHSEGYYTEALEQGGHSEGGFTIAVKKYGHSEGFKTLAYNPYAHAQNENTIAIANSSTAMGINTMAGVCGFKIVSAGAFYKEYIIDGTKYIDGKLSRVEAESKLKNDTLAFLLNRQCRLITDGNTGIVTITGMRIMNDSEFKNKRFRVTIASDEYITISPLGEMINYLIPLLNKGEEYLVRNMLYTVGSNIIGKGSVAIGEDTIAAAARALVGGQGTIATRPNQTVLGAYNRLNADAVFIVGNGSSDTDRSNAMEVLFDGKIKGFGEPTEDNDLVTKKYADSIKPKEVEEWVPNGNYQVGDVVFDEGRQFRLIKIDEDYNPYTQPREENDYWTDITRYTPNILDSSKVFWRRRGDIIKHSNGRVYICVAERSDYDPEDEYGIYDYEELGNYTTPDDVRDLIREVLEPIEEELKMINEGGVE